MGNIIRTENVVGRPDSAVKAFVGAGVVSLADAESLSAFHLGGKWEYGRRFSPRRGRSLCPA